MRSVLSADKTLLLSVLCFSRMLISNVCYELYWPTLFPGIFLKPFKKLAARVLSGLKPLGCSSCFYPIKHLLVFKQYLILYMKSLGVYVQKTIDNSIESTISHIFYLLGLCEIKQNVCGLIVEWPTHFRQKASHWISVQGLPGVRQSWTRSSLYCKRESNETFTCCSFHHVSYQSGFQETIATLTSDCSEILEKELQKIVLIGSKLIKTNMWESK